MSETLKALKELQEEERLNYALLMDYKVSWHIWTLRMERFVTDSSLGGGNTFNYEGGVSDVVADRICCKLQTEY